MATYSPSRAARPAAQPAFTFNQAQALRALIVAGEGLVYLVLTLPLVLALDGFARLVALGGALALAGPPAVVFCPRVIEVPYLQAQIIVERNRQRLGALLAGAHLWLPALYPKINQVRLYPAERECLVEHIVMAGGPPQTVLLRFTLMPNLPHPAPRTLPQQGISEAATAQQRRMIGFVNLAANDRERWAQLSQNVVERGMREFFFTLRVKELHDPQGRSVLPTAVLYARLTAHLLPLLQEELGHTLRVHAVEVRAVNDSGMTDWQQNLLQLQELSAATGNLTSQQVLLLGEMFKLLHGGPEGAGMDPAMLLLWGQGGAG
ncbi:MAG: hypothetical protein M3Z04_08605, partial [Chloroflexota bacterium]|nr:hypothetical protein [Chloroflexota bacterium]